ncbi:hypothetical protein ABZT06_03760 [Streptomyces sp. NPDC005483]|uniref:hypothetical protein n=1 Tax=Streptomyces sp. NPDC005483 TaxID=3154882 RepID=UPI0033A8721F
MHQPTPPSTDDGRPTLGAPTTVWKGSAGSPRVTDIGTPEPRFPNGTQHTSTAAEHRRNPNPEQDRKDTTPSLSWDRQPSPPPPEGPGTTPADTDVARPDSTFDGPSCSPAFPRGVQVAAELLFGPPRPS